MKIDVADKVMLSRYLTKKNELFENEIKYCENLIKKIVKIGRASCRERV